MKKIIFCLMILFSVSTIAYAEGLPVLEFAQIISNPIYNACSARYYGGEDIGGEFSTEANFIKVVINKNQVKATCRFTDISSDTYETNAEVGKILYCELITEGCECWGGTGHVTVAANHGDNTGPGGSVTLKCTFDRDECTCGGD